MMQDCLIKECNVKFVRSLETGLHSKNKTPVLGNAISVLIVELKQG